jgi:hypothetical protein
MQNEALDLVELILGEKVPDDEVNINDILEGEKNYLEQIREREFCVSTV